MRTRNYFKYLLATLALSGNVSLGMAQSPTLTWTRGTTRGSDVWYMCKTAVNWDDVHTSLSGNAHSMVDVEYWDGGRGLGLTTPQSGELTRIKSTVKDNIYCTAVEEIKLSIGATIPSYTKITCKGLKFGTYSKTTASAGSYHGCELFYWGTERTVNRSFTTSDNSNLTSPYSLLKNCRRGSGESYTSLTEKEIVYLNSGSEQINNVDVYFGVLAYAKRTGGGASKTAEFAVRYDGSNANFVFSPCNQIQYDLNGGIGVSNSEWNTSNNVTASVPKKVGYKFAGWKDVNGQYVAQGTQYVADNTHKGPIKLVAQWEECGLFLGDLYMDYQNKKTNSDNNANIAHYVNPSNNDGLRFAEQVKKENNQDMAPYEWGDFTKSSTTYIINLKTKKEAQVWRAGVGMFEYGFSVPAYTSIRINAKYDLVSEKTGEDKHQGAHGAELIHFGTLAWSPNTKDNFSTSNASSYINGKYIGTVSDNVEIKNNESIVKCYSNNGAIVNGSKNASLVFNNSDGSSVREMNHYFSLVSYIHRNGNKNISESTTLTINSYEPTYTYYATVTFHHLNGTTTQSCSAEGSNTIKLQGVYPGYRDGYRFVGWSRTENAGQPDYDINGNGQNFDFSPYDEENDCGLGPIDLYAVWAQTPCVVTLKHNDGTGDVDYVDAYFGQQMPNVDKNGNELQIPTRIGYEFAGYTRYDGKKFYDENMNSTNTWDLAYGEKLDAQWTPKSYIVTLDADGGVFPDNVISKNIGNFPTITAVDAYEVEIDNEKKMVGPFIQFSCSYEMAMKASELVQALAKKPGYELLGWYDNAGNEVVTAEEKSRNCKLTGNGGYWSNGDWKWHHLDDVKLTAHYRQKYQVSNDGSIISFDNEKVEAGEDWLWSVVNDLVGAAQEVGTAEKPVMAFDLRASKNQWTGSNYDCGLVMESLRGYDFISPNVLVYFNEKSYNDANCNNAILSDNTCQNLVVTDRYPMKIPYEFTAQTATYERNGAQKSENGENSQDAMWAQSYKSVWGTLCLPYPITNNHSYRDESGIDYQIKFYELYGTHDNYMQFREMAEDKKIEANTPVLYCRTAGVGSAVTVQESSSGVEVPANIENGSYTTNPVIYSTELKEEMKRNENAERVVEEDWQFKGTLETKKFCTKAYSDLCIQKGAQAEFLAGAEVLDPDNEKIPYREIYYFKQDKFTHMTSGVTILPYRAYFDRKKIEESTDQIGESKVSSYSILVMDDDGTTTDITNLIDNHEAKGNGKIYDLSGRRVKQPVKGSIYIVDGKKKMY